MYQRIKHWDHLALALFSQCLSLLLSCIHFYAFFLKKRTRNMSMPMKNISNDIALLFSLVVKLLLYPLALPVSRGTAENAPIKMLKSTKQCDVSLSMYTPFFIFFKPGPVFFSFCIAFFLYYVFQSHRTFIQTFLSPCLYSSWRSRHSFLQRTWRISL